MFTILRNIWPNELHQRRVQIPGTDIDQILPAFHAASAKDLQTPLLTCMDQEQVRQAILRLPVEFREIILLREFEDLSYQEIAGVLKCPIGTVLSRLGKARSKLLFLHPGRAAIQVKIPEHYGHGLRHGHRVIDRAGKYFDPPYFGGTRDRSLAPNRLPGRPERRPAHGCSR
jgi:hypothetical protein